MSAAVNPNPTQGPAAIAEARSAPSIAAPDASAADLHAQPTPPSRVKRFFRAVFRPFAIAYRAVAKFVADFGNPDLSASRVLLVGRVFIGVITVALLGLGYRVYQLQTNPDEKIDNLVDSQQSKTRIEARRGTLEDRIGRPLAVTRVVYGLYVDPEIIKDPSTFSEKVGFALGLDPADIERKINTRVAARDAMDLDTRYVPIARQLTDDQYARFLKLKQSKGALKELRGLGIEPRLRRDYPQGTLAGQVIGISGNDGGVDGVERAFNAELRGVPGFINYTRDSAHSPLWVTEDGYNPPTDGKSIRLSIDLTIQNIAEAELAATVKQYSAQSGELIVLDPYTGEILAMANYPLVEPTDFGKPEAKDRQRNRSVTDTYEPGSTFKPIVWAMATEQGFARPSEMIDCHGGFYVSPEGRRLHDAHGIGTVTWETVLVQSSNIGMAIVGQRLGAQRLFDACSKFGIGKLPGSGLPGEVNGKLRPVKNWTHYSVTSIPMGQEVSVTALQMARAFSVFANEGYLITPTIRAVDPADPAARPTFQRVLKPETARLTRDIMHRVVTEGTGRKANSPMYEIWGKTGTAQVAGPRGGYIPDAYTASFVCGAPTDKPRVVVVSVIHRPDKSKGHFGGTVAAPAAMRVIEQTLPYLGVAPLPPDSARNTGGTVAISNHDLAD